MGYRSEPSLFATGFDSLVGKIEVALSMASGMRGVKRSASFVAVADPMSTLKDMIASTTVSTAPDMSAISATSDIVKGIASVDAPQPTPTPLDPRCAWERAFVLCAY